MSDEATPALYIDTCVFIAAFEDESPIKAPARELFRFLTTKPGLAVTSVLTLAELLAPTSNATMSAPQRRDLYLSFFDRSGAVSLLQVTREVLLETVILRDQHSHRLPDAIHLATATLSRCRLFMSSDRHARRAPPGLTWLTPAEKDVEGFLAANA